MNLQLILAKYGIKAAAILVVVMAFAGQQVRIHSRDNKITALTIELDKVKAESDATKREVKELNAKLDDMEKKRQEVVASIHNPPRDPEQLRKWVLGILEKMR